MDYIIKTLQNMPHFLRSAYDAFDEKYIFLGSSIKLFFSQTTDFFQDFCFKIGSSASWHYLCWSMAFVTSAMGLLPFFLKASFLATGFVTFCVLAKLFEVLFLPIQQKLVARANGSVDILKTKLLSLDSGGIEVLLFDIYVMFRWLFYFFFFYIADEYYIGHIVSTVLPFVGKITWNLFSFLKPLAHVLGFYNPSIDSMLLGFVDFYHKTLLNINNVLEILLLSVVVLAKTWLNVRNLSTDFWQNIILVRLIHIIILS